jgi:hypothetical protein
MFQRLKSEHSGKNSAAAFAYLLAGNAKQASINFNGGGVQWVEGYSGDSQRVWVAYNEAGETVGYKDLNGTELTLADLDLIGGVITKYSNIAEQNPTYQMKFRLAQTPGYTPRPIYAAKMPENCIR